MRAAISGRGLTAAALALWLVAGAAPATADLRISELQVFLNDHEVTVNMVLLGAIPAGQSVVKEGKIPYLPEALARRDENRAGWPKTDPEAACYLPGIPRATYMPHPFQIVQGDDDILFVYSFANANRAVHMKDHRTLDDVPVDLWMGWSNGRWEGDTLVVEVIANDDRTWFDRAGNYHSDALKVTERITPMTRDALSYEATIDDPKIFTRPWKISMPLYRRLEPQAELQEFNCVELTEETLWGHLKKKTSR